MRMMDFNVYEGFYLFAAAVKTNLNKYDHKAFFGILKDIP